MILAKSFRQMKDSLSLIGSPQKLTWKIDEASILPNRAVMSSLCNSGLRWSFQAVHMGRKEKDSPVAGGSLCRLSEEWPLKWA